MLACKLERSWQALQSRVSVGRRRNRVSWLRPLARSTVTATARQPAFSARFTMACPTSPLLGAQNWYPIGLPARGTQVLAPEAGGGRQNLQMVADLGGARGGDLALVVEGSLAADRREHDRACVFHPEDLGRHVDLADVDQPARTELEFQKALAIGAQRDLVVDAGGHVAEMRGRNVLAADRLQIGDVDAHLGQLAQVIVAH